MAIENELVSTLTLARSLIEDNDGHYMHDVHIRVIHMMIRDTLAQKREFWQKYLRELQAKADREHAA